MRKGREKKNIIFPSPQFFSLHRVCFAPLVGQIIHYGDTRASQHRYVECACSSRTTLCKLGSCPHCTAIRLPNLGDLEKNSRECATTFPTCFCSMKQVHVCSSVSLKLWSGAAKQMWMAARRDLGHNCMHTHDGWRRKMKEKKTRTLINAWSYVVFALLLHTFWVRG